MAMAKAEDLLDRLRDLSCKMQEHWEPEVFFSELLSMYGTAKDSIKRALNNESGYNVASKVVDETMARPDLGIEQCAYFRFLKDDADVAPALDKLRELEEVSGPKHKFQFLICAGPTTLVMFDMIEHDNIMLGYKDLPSFYSFMLPLLEGRRSRRVSTKNADRKAYLKLMRLLDTLAEHNHIADDNMQQFNSFMVRIVFCFFAEDTGMFELHEEHAFSSAFSKLVHADGSNAKKFFEDLFTVLNTKETERDQLKHVVADELLCFPYVNGGLFGDNGFIPEFDMVTRNQFVDCGDLSWSEISPAVFGAMFQSAMHPEVRRNMGAHYTSEDNILRVIKPLFLDKLYAEFEELKKKAEPLKLGESKVEVLKLEEGKVESLKLEESKAEAFKLEESKADSLKHEEGKAEALKIEEVTVEHASTALRKHDEMRAMFYEFLERIGKLKFLDPACGCGNFLIIAYKELRILESKVLEYINAGVVTDSFISIDQFYGIEIEEWPVEIAHLSMCLMQQLMNLQVNARIGSNISSIPLKTSATIVCANALTTDWNEVLPAQECSYILGNPPFSGFKYATKEQKEWVRAVFPPQCKLGMSDIVTAWFVKASDYMMRNKSIQSAFVATSSICQGEQVATLWSQLLAKGIHIVFAHTSLRWSKAAAGKAEVFCVIVGFSYEKSESPKLIHYDRRTKESSVEVCKQISPYLTDCISPVIITRRSSALSTDLELEYGNMPNDGGNLLLSFEEGEELQAKHPELSPYLKRFIGSKELINSEWRYCLWLKEADRADWSTIREIKRRVETCGAWRAKQVHTGGAYKVKDSPWRFGHVAPNANPDRALVLPRISSELRTYIPLDFVDAKSIVGDSAFLLPNALIYEFGVLSSRMHNVWTKFTCGRYGRVLRYSRDMSFNTFVWPEASAAQHDDIEKLANDALRLRDKYKSDMTLGQMYSPETMPEDIKLAHERLDAAVERAYRPEPFKDDEERLAFLLELYSRALEHEQQKKPKSRSSKGAK